MSGDTIYHILKTCQTVAGIIRMNQFHESSISNSWRFFSGLQNGVVARRNHGSNSTLSSVDSIGSGPRGPGIATNPGGGGPDRRKRVRESYMEAVSMSGSMINDDRSSMTSEPIDL